LQISRFDARLRSNTSPASRSSSNARGTAARDAAGPAGGACP